MKCAVAGADNYQTGDSRGQEISIKKPFIMSGSEYQPRPRVSTERVREHISDLTSQSELSKVPVITQELKI